MSESSDIKEYIPNEEITPEKAAAFVTEIIKKSTPKKSKKLEENLTPLYTPDDTVEYEADDEFHHGEIVDVLEHTIVRSEGSINIAMYGEWGVGKSTIINFLKNRIKVNKELHKKFQLIIVDAWKLSPDILRQELLEELAKQLNVPKSEIEKIHDELHNTQQISTSLPLSRNEKIVEYLKRAIPLYFVLPIFFGLQQWGSYVGENYLTPAIVGSVLVPITIFGMQTIYQMQKSAEISSRRTIQKAESSHQFKKLFDLIIKYKEKSKLIIALDNLDRCDEKSAVKILTSVKTFMGDESCIYIVPCDESALIKHLKKEYGSDNDNNSGDKQAKEFLRKFFQVTIHVPPQIKGDLKEYVKKRMEVFSEIPFDEFVNEILIMGTRINPRKLRQYLYNTAITFKLAQLREDSSDHIIRKGIITSHTGFLAKIIVIKEEWPEIYNNIEDLPSLYSSFEKNLSGFTEPEKPELEKKIEDIFKKNPDFKQFLRATSLVTVDDIRPFLRLGQESYERGSSDMDRINANAIQNDLEAVISDLEPLKEAEKEIRIVGIISLIQYHIENDDYQFAFNVMNILLELYEKLSSQLQSKIITKFATYLSTKRIKDFVWKFDPSKLFPLILKIDERPRNELLKEYCQIISSHTPVIKKLLEQFIENAESLPNEIIKELDENLMRLGSSNPEEFIKIIETILKDDTATKVLIGNKTMDELVGRIDADASDQNKRKVKIFLKLKNNATEQNKIKFIKKIFQIVNKKDSSVLDQTSKWAIQVLYDFSEGDFDSQSAIEVYKEITPLIEKFGSFEDRKIILPLVFRIMPHLQEPEQKSLVELFTPESIAPDAAQFIQLTQFLKENGINIFSNNLFFNKIMEQLQNLLPHDDLFEVLLTDISTNQLDMFVKSISNRINSYNINQISQTINVLEKLEDTISKKIFNEMLVAVLNRLDAHGFQESHPKLTDVIKLLPKSNQKVTDLYSDIILKWITQNNDDQRNKGIQLASQSFEHFSKAKKISSITEVLNNLEQHYQQNNPGRAKQNLNLLMPQFDTFNQQQKNKLLEILIAQLAINKPPLIQIQSLSTLQEINLGKNFEKTQSSILSLVTKTKDGNVKNACNVTCEKLGIPAFVRSEPFAMSGGTKEDGQIPESLARPITVEANDDGVAHLQYEVQVNQPKKSPCSSIRIHIKSNGNIRYSSNWLGYVGAEEGLPFETGLIKLEKLKPGTNEIVIQPEGKEGGCNQGFLGSYEGIVHFYKS